MLISHLQSMAPKKLNRVSPVHLTLNVLAFLAWIGCSFGLWYNWQLQPIATLERSIQVNELEYPTIIACNAMREFNIASRSACKDEYGPINRAGQDTPSPKETAAETCIPVARVVFYEPDGPRYCLKYQAPKHWRIQTDIGTILKASIELLGPNGEEHYLPSQGVTLFVLSTSDWERAVFRYNKQGGNGTDFLKLFDDITRASSTAVAAVQHHTNVVVHVSRWTTIGGSSSMRYHLTTSKRPIHPQLLKILDAERYHLCTLRMMYASDRIQETLEYQQLEWLKLFGTSAAVAASLDLLVRFICFFLRAVLRHFCRDKVIEEYFEEAVELEDWNMFTNDDDDGL